jgi:hypothetical protein
MRDLTNMELKAVEKFRQRYALFCLAQPHGGLTNGQILKMLRYAKRLAERRMKMKKPKRKYLIGRTPLQLWGTRGNAEPMTYREAKKCAKMNCYGKVKYRVYVVEVKSER